MTQRVESVRTETVQEYLARGGKITRVPNGGEYTSDNVTRPATRPYKEQAEEDVRDGLSPNLRWIGGDNA